MTDPIPSKFLCPKIGLLGDRCTKKRLHGGKHAFPPNPRKTPGIRPTEKK